MSIKIDASKSNVFLFGHVIQLKKDIAFEQGHTAKRNKTSHQFFFIHISYISIFEQRCLQFDHYQVSIGYRSYISSLFVFLYLSPFFLSLSFVLLATYLCASFFVYLFLCSTLLTYYSVFLVISQVAQFLLPSFSLYVFIALCMSICLFVSLFVSSLFSNCWKRRSVCLSVV